LFNKTGQHLFFKQKGDKLYTLGKETLSNDFFEENIEETIDPMKLYNWVQNNFYGLIMNLNNNEMVANYLFSKNVEAVFFYYNSSSNYHTKLLESYISEVVKLKRHNYKDLHFVAADISDKFSKVFIDIHNLGFYLTSIERDPLLMDQPFLFIINPIMNGQLFARHVFTRNIELQDMDE